MHSICSNFCQLKLNNTDDPNRKGFNPDKFTDGYEQLRDAENRKEYYFFIAHYVRKVFPDNKITQLLRATPGSSFLDLITTSDIAYVITVVKNGRDMWDERLDGKESNAEGSGQGSSMYMHVCKCCLLVYVSIFNSRPIHIR